VLALAPAAQAAEPAALAWWKHVEFLASDDRQGREAGSPGHREAAEYVARHFREAGLKPAAGGGFLQPVKLRTRQIVAGSGEIALLRSTGEKKLTYGEEFYLNSRADLAPRTEAGLVFLGYGLSAAEAGHDDFAGMDLKGKVAVYLTGGPAAVSGALLAHLGSARERALALRKAGAIGSISVPDPNNQDVPWERSVRASLRPSMSLEEPAADDSRLVRFSAVVRPARAQVLFEGSPYRYAELAEMVKAKQPLPRFPLPAKVRASVQLVRGEAVSENVVGRLDGSDPERRDEFILLTAHLDHLGLAADGVDRIFNGAMDNASGVATMIEVARALAKNPPKRSVLFCAVTGEEKGLLGSRLLAAHPGVAVRAVAANINFDMFLPIHPMKSLMAIGMEESTLRFPVEAAARRLGLGLQGDPEPARRRFIRSDQYSFIQRGVPAAALKVGYGKDSPEERIQKDWIAARYHAVGDDLSQPVDFGAAVKFNRAVEEVVREIGAGPKPQWNEGSFLRRFSRSR
jgi:hypothetical protein